MDAEKIAFLFGELPGDEDPDDEEVRHHLVEERVLAQQAFYEDGLPVGAFAVVIHQLIADQIAEEKPPEVWRTARRLLDDGLDATLVMSNLVLAVNTAMAAALDSGEPVDDASYIEELERLPLPPVREMLDVFTGITRERRSTKETPWHLSPSGTPDRRARMWWPRPGRPTTARLRGRGFPSAPPSSWPGCSWISPTS
jgi:hypothetical protein